MKEKVQIKGFQFAGIYSGIKEHSKKLDLALIYSEKPCSVAGTFTSNRVKAAPVVLCEKRMKKAKAQAVVINSGNANACTGAKGLKNAERMVKAAAKALQVSEELIFISSTGKIGIQLPIEKIEKGIIEASEALHADNLALAAQAILTTDLFSKVHVLQGKCQGKTYTLAGFAKGAGMIEPAMRPVSNSKHATMLGYFLTDLAVSSSLLQAILNRVVDASFNCITVDGDMSTNDTALALANGMAGNTPIKAGSKEAKEFEKLFEELAQTLALQMVEDGEGATKVVEIKIEGARNSAEARQIAYSVGRSQLVKTAFFGQDPNWGRVLAAVGYSGATFTPQKTDIYYGPVKLVSKGLAVGGDSERKAHEIMKNKYFTVRVVLKQGKSAFRLWTSDLNYDYVKLNAEYRT